MYDDCVARTAAIIGVIGQSATGTRQRGNATAKHALKTDILGLSKTVEYTKIAINERKKRSVFNAVTDEHGPLFGKRTKRRSYYLSNSHRWSLLF